MILGLNLVLCFQFGFLNSVFGILHAFIHVFVFLTIFIVSGIRSVIVGGRVFSSVFMYCFIWLGSSFISDYM